MSVQSYRPTATVLKYLDDPCQRVKAAVALEPLLGSWVSSKIINEETRLTEEQVRAVVRELQLNTAWSVRLAQAERGFSAERLAGQHLLLHREGHLLALTSRYLAVGGQKMLSHVVDLLTGQRWLKMVDIEESQGFVAKEVRLIQGTLQGIDGVLQVLCYSPDGSYAIVPRFTCDLLAFTSNRRLTMGRHQYGQVALKLMKAMREIHQREVFLSDQTQANILLDIEPGEPCDACFCDVALWFGVDHETMSAEYIEETRMLNRQLLAARLDELRERLDLAEGSLSLQALSDPSQTWLQVMEVAHKELGP